MLAVVGERRVRGAVERTYVLRTSAARLEIAKMSREGWRMCRLTPSRISGHATVASRAEMIAFRLFRFCQ